MKKKENKNNYLIPSAVLFALYACSENGNTKVSKIAIQKILYLAVALSSIKNTILDFIRFQYQTRGPYSLEVQNTLDSLVSKGQVNVVDYEKKRSNATHINYEISKEGKDLVEKLIQIENEAENLWWISSICKLALIYSKEEYNSKYSGLDKIIDLVYQEPTFLQGKIKSNSNEDYKKGFRKLPINFNFKKGITVDLINFSKEYLRKNNIVVDKQNERWVAELLLFNFFEFLYNKILLANK